MFERILERISVSKYKDNFILKGGLLLSAMFGIENRFTKDMDTTITGIDISKSNFLKILNEILSIDLKDGINFNVINITDIREDDEYGGNKYHIIGKLDKLKVNLEIDISTGDKITPRELKYKYHSIFENKYILINSYNIETILAEKIETILRRGTFNSRMKDYYDLYFLLTKMKNEINKKDLKEAINNTFKKRDSYKYLNDYKQIINSINENEKLINLWFIYSNKYNYAKNIDIQDILKLIEDIITEINLDIITL